MAHARNTIKTAFLNALAGVGTMDGDVIVDPIYPTDPAELPVLRLFIERDDLNEDGGEMGNEVGRDLVVIVEAVASASSGVANTLDTLCYEVEYEVHSDVALGALAFDLFLRSTEIDLDGEGENPVGTARMEWVVSYRTDRTDPDTVL